ncbi:MAG: hypothetical protein KDD53_09505, partial [Bdellovibrionales bacterium]|nr:hypothetical protein [Bdellovibrionales bacterium]
PQASISEANNSVMSFLSDLLSIIEPLGYAVPLLGYHPSHTPDTAPIMPKTRYDIMYSYMPKVGNRGREMMKLTSSLQVSVDFNSEKDALNKLNLANRAAPYFIAMSANSSVTQCEFAGVASARARAWTDTDPARCGFPKFIFNSGQTFSDYVEWALDVPMYFVERQDRKIDMTKYTFRQFLAGAINEIKDTELPFATRDDWETHLSTLFPWARLRHYVEIRAFDMNSPDINFELMLLIDRLFNNESILANLHNFLGPPDQARTEALLNAAINFGLDGEDLREGSKKILSLAMHASPTEDFVALSSRINSWKFDENKKEVERSYREYVNARLLKAPRPGL